MSRLPCPLRPDNDGALNAPSPVHNSNCPPRSRGGPKQAMMTFFTDGRFPVGEGEALARERRRQTGNTLELRSLNLGHEDRVLSIEQVEWIARNLRSSKKTDPSLAFSG